MGWNDRNDDEGYSDFLRGVLKFDELDDPAPGIVRRLLDKGSESLSEKQQHVFQKYVLDVYVTEKCTLCQIEIPWCEMLEAHDNGGYCGWCAARLSRDN